MNRTEKSILAALAVVATTLVGLVGYLGYRTATFYSARPLGPALSLPQPTYADLASAASTAPGMVDSTAAPDVPAPASPLCGGPPVMNLLAIGSDARSSTYLYGLADVIRFARVDFVTPRVSVLELPRDLWVEIPEISDDIDQDHEKLNQAYLYGNPGFGYYDDPSAGPGLLARTLDLNFGLRADHYVAVNMVTFTKIVDAVDGIDITLEEAVDGRTADDRSKRLAFAAGRHHLDGTQALTLARIRIDGVFERAKNQNLVLCALRRRLLQPDVVTSIPDLIRSFQDNIQTDLSLDQLGQLACLGTQLQSDNLVFASFPQELFAQSRVYDPVFKKRVFVWEADPDVLRDYASRFQAGLWPAPGADDPSSEDEGFQCPP